MRKLWTLKLPKHVWLISNSLSLCLLFLLLFLWYLINNRYTSSLNQISTPKELSDKLTQYQQTYLIDADTRAVVIVPTGIFIQSFEFSSANTAQVSGYVWQKISKKDLEAGFTPGIVFPEAKSIGRMEKAYEQDYEDYRLIGWHFYGVSLLQKFNYDNYPFDIQSIWIRIWPTDFYFNVLQVPDLVSYETTVPGQVFGLEKDIATQGFDIKETYFDMPIMGYDTSFGDPPELIEKNSLELYFNIIVKRHLVNAFLIYLLPIMVTWSILFAITMIISNDKQFARRVSLSTTQLFTALGGIVFAIILMNNSLRSNFPGQPFLYLEYFYMITYVIIILIACNAYLITAKTRVHQALDKNLLPQILFWPLILTSLILITLVEFFVFPNDVLHWHRGPDMAVP